MATLQLYITESWPDSDGREPLEWALRDAGGAVLSQGRAEVSALPAAERLELIAPAAAVLLTAVRLPAQRGDKARRLLPFAVEEKLAGEPDSVHVAMGPQMDDGQTAVAVVDKAWLGNTLALLERAGRRPRRMVPETLLPELEPDTWSVAWNGTQGFLRSGFCAGQALDGGADGPPLALVSAVREAKVTGTVPRRIMLRPVPGRLLADWETWSAALGVPVAPGPDWDWRRAALAPAPLDLLQGAFATRGFGPEALPRLKPALLLAGLIVLLQCGAMAADWWQLKREKQQLAKGMEASFRQAFPEATVVVDPALQMARQLASLRRAAGQPDAGDFLPLLAKIAPLLDGGSLRAIRYEAGALKLDMTAAGASAVDGLRRRLDGAGVKVEMTAENAGPDGVPVRLTVTAE